MPAFAGRSSFRTWLFTDRHQRVPHDGRAAPADGEPVDPDRPLVDQVRIDPYPGEAPGSPGGGTAPDARYDRHESIELAFVAAVQLLPATQRAAVLLRDVLGFSARETAAALDTSVASVTSALQRGRSTLRTRLPDRSEQASLRALGDVGLRTLVDRYVSAWERGDVPGWSRCWPATPASRCPPATSGSAVGPRSRPSCPSRWAAGGGWRRPGPVARSPSPATSGTTTRCVPRPLRRPGRRARWCRGRDHGVPRRPVGAGAGPAGTLAGGRITTAGRPARRRPPLSAGPVEVRRRRRGARA